MFGFAPVMFLGRGIFNYSLGIVPHRRPLTVVLGAPIPVQQNTQPTIEDISELHTKYIQSLIGLYQQYNPLYGDPSVELVLT